MLHCHTPIATLFWASRFLPRGRLALVSQQRQFHLSRTVKHTTGQDWECASSGSFQHGQPVDLAICIRAVTLHQRLFVSFFQELSQGVDHRFCSVTDPEFHLLFLHECKDVVSVLVANNRLNRFRRSRQKTYPSLCGLRPVVHVFGFFHQRDNAGVQPHWASASLARPYAHFWAQFAEEPTPSGTCCGNFRWEFLVLISLIIFSF